MFKPVPTRVDYVALEHEVQRWWDDHDIADKYMARNQHANQRWSFIDGPITANNPMGVHHAWGRSYKDLYNRFWTMRGRKLRYQNGFDCQGLWIEVEVEKELGFKSKHDIETYGVAEFVEACKERVRRFSAIQTEQSKRLAYWMDWDNSYYTNSDENNYTIWAFLKKVWSKGWLYKGHDTMPWCPRCGTGISQHEIVTEGYQEITHKSVYLKFPLNDRPGESLLVWTTTPWTLAANVAAAVHPELIYEKVRQGDDVLYVSKGARETAIRGEHEVIGEVQGADLVSLTYRGPFDELPVQEGVVHRVIAWEEVSDEEGTGIVHIAPGAGAEDFALSKEYGLDVIAPLDEDGTYLKNGKFGFLEGKFAGDVPEEIFASLREKGLLYRVQDYTHRYPVCWRCASELVFRLVDEWFINMDGELNDGSGKTLRQQIQETSNQVTWIPEFGKAREYDWLKNMHDWMISKKRYYGLALPIYECKACGHFEVIGSERELQDRAIHGWLEFEGHSPHRPWVDAVKIACSQCGQPVERIKEVGNPWLDAGIVPFSTLHYRDDPDYWKQWFPADWVSESFPGQFRNWFYALLAMGTVMVLDDPDYHGAPPFQSLFSYALLRDEHGEEMHKSKGNAIWFEDAAEKMGVDVMRWMYMRTPPANNLNFGFGAGDELKRGFLSTLWNTMLFFLTYASIDKWEVPFSPPASPLPRTEQDQRILAEFKQVMVDVTSFMEGYDSMSACRRIEDFVDLLSNVYVRLGRRAFWKAESDDEKQSAYLTLWECLSGLTRLIAPFMPFLSERMYDCLVRDADSSAPESVHLTDWPYRHVGLIDRVNALDEVEKRRVSEIRTLRRLMSLGRSARAKANIKVRQPLRGLYVRVPQDADKGTVLSLKDQLVEELNVKTVNVIADEGDYFEYQVRPNLPVLGPKYGQDVGKIQRALGQADKATLVREVASGGPVHLDGFVLQPAELLVTTTGKPGYAVAEESGYAVAVSTEVTPELRDEGLARELVRRIQEMRKSAGFEIADRIGIAYEGDPELKRVFEVWRDYIEQETLATSLDNGDQGGFTEVLDIDGMQLNVAIERVS